MNLASEDDRYTLVMTPTARRQLTEAWPEAAAFAGHEGELAIGEREPVRWPQLMISGVVGGPASVLTDRGPQRQ